MTHAEARKLAEEMKALAAKATPEPWDTFIRGRTIDIHVGDKPVVHWAGFDSSAFSIKKQKHNARFLARSRTLGPALADALIAALDRIEVLEEDKPCT